MQKGIGGGMAKLAGTILKTFGGVTGSMAKMFTGLAGWVAMGVLALGKLGLAADEFAKKANKRFLTIRGPDIMTPDVKGQFKSFNDQLFSAAKNIRIGMNADEVAGFMEQLTAAGSHLSLVENKMVSYREAVYAAAKASRTLGVEIPYIADKMSMMMTELHLNVKEIDDVFVQTAFDAKKAGLSTDRFFTAIENTSASLAFYGVFIKSASENMKQFAESQIMSAKDAAAMTEELGQSFTKMTDEQKAAFVGLVGPEKVRDMFKETEKEWRKKAMDLETTIKVARTTGDTDQVERLLNQQAAYNEKANRAMYGVQSKNAVAMGQYLPLIADRSKELIMGFAQRVAGTDDLSKVTGDRLLLIKSSSGIHGHFGGFDRETRFSRPSKRHRDEQGRGRW